MGGTSFINEVLEAAGARNVFRDVRQGYFVTSAEEVLQRAPEAIVVLHEDARPPDARLGWSGVPAVKAGRVITGLDFDLLSRPGPRFVEAIGVLREALERVMARSG